jgi:hypothetical protein
MTCLVWEFYKQNGVVGYTDVMTNPSLFKICLAVLNVLEGYAHGLVIKRLILN